MTKIDSYNLTSAAIFLSTSSSNKPWKYCLCNGKIVDTFLKPFSGHGQLSTFGLMTIVRHIAFGAVLGILTTIYVDKIDKS
jgi:hypothetical protein